MRDAVVCHARIIVVARIVFAVHLDEPFPALVSSGGKPCVITASGVVDPFKISHWAFDFLRDFKSATRKRIDALDLEKVGGRLEEFFFAIFQGKIERKKAIFPLILHENILRRPGGLRIIVGQEEIVLIVFEPDARVAVAGQQQRRRILVELLDVRKKSLFCLRQLFGDAPSFVICECDLWNHGGKIR